LTGRGTEPGEDPVVQLRRPPLPGSGGRPTPGKSGARGTTGPVPGLRGGPRRHEVRHRQLRASSPQPLLQPPL
ncbi:uncharacterized protein METZ01_LOCUS516147, partial [marine metagenome]